MTWDSILKIPFISKKKHLGRGKYIFSGYVYYLLNNEGKVLRDFLLLDDDDIQEYRPNDNSMSVGKDGTGTEFWKTAFVKNFRPQIFDHDPINFQVKKATKKTINLLNEYTIKNANTALATEGFLSGSNSSGADGRIEKSPIVASGNEFHGLRFVNPMKKMRFKYGNRNASQKYPISQCILKKAITLSLKEYLNKFKEAKKYFYSYNPESYDLIYNNEEWDTVKLYFEDLEKVKLDKQGKSTLENIKKILDLYFKGKMKRETLISRLRGFQRFSLLIEYSLKKEDVIIDNKEKPKNMDAAHLIEVKNIKKDTDLYLIANKDNGLLLPKDIHWKLDKDEDYSLNSNFEFIEKGKIVAKVSDAYINDNRRKNIKLRNSSL